MKKLFLTLCFFGFVGCKNDSVKNKIIDGLPVSSTIVIQPAQATQQFLVVHRDAAGSAISIIGRLNAVNPQYPELTGPDGLGRYTLQTFSPRYTYSTVTLQFKDSNGTTINPIQTQSSSATVKSVEIGISGQSPSFNFTSALTLTLETAGNIEANKRLSGTSQFTNTPYTINYNLPSPGIKTIFEGFTAGQMTASGNNSATSQALTLELSFSSDRTSSGSLTWDGETGTLRFDDKGDGYVITQNQRIILN
ncbi:MAG: hypothetical protein ACKVQC_02480 [Elusimicrobiota bacterium]